MFLAVLKDVLSLTLGEYVSAHMEPPDVVLTIMTSFQIVLCALCVFASVASPSAHCQAPDALPWTCASSCAPAARVPSPLAATSSTLQLQAATAMQSSHWLRSRTLQTSQLHYTTSTAAFRLLLLTMMPVLACTTDPVQHPVQHCVPVTVEDPMRCVINNETTCEDSAAHSPHRRTRIGSLTSSCGACESLTCCSWEPQPATLQEPRCSPPPPCTSSSTPPTLAARPHSPPPTTPDGSNRRLLPLALPLSSPIHQHLPYPDRTPLSTGSVFPLFVLCAPRPLCCPSEPQQSIALAAGPPGSSPTSHARTPPPSRPPCGVGACECQRPSHPAVHLVRPTWHVGACECHPSRPAVRVGAVLHEDTPLMALVMAPMHAATALVKWSSVQWPSLLSPTSRCAVRAARAMDLRHRHRAAVTARAAALSSVGAAHTIAGSVTFLFVLRAPLPSCCSSEPQQTTAKTAAESLDSARTVRAHVSSSCYGCNGSVALVFTSSDACVCLHAHGSSHMYMIACDTTSHTPRRHQQLTLSRALVSSTATPTVLTLPSWPTTPPAGGTEYLGTRHLTAPWTPGALHDSLPIRADAMLAALICVGAALWLRARPSPCTVFSLRRLLTIIALASCIAPTSGMASRDSVLENLGPAKQSALRAALGVHVISVGLHAVLAVLSLMYSLPAVHRAVLDLLGADSDPREMETASENTASSDESADAAAPCVHMGVTSASSAPASTLADAARRCVHVGATSTSNASASTLTGLPTAPAPSSPINQPTAPVLPSPTAPALSSPPSQSRLGSTRSCHEGTPYRRPPSQPSQSASSAAVITSGLAWLGYSAQTAAELVQRRREPQGSSTDALVSPRQLQFAGATQSPPREQTRRDRRTGRSQNHARLMGRRAAALAPFVRRTDRTSFVPTLLCMVLAAHCQLRALLARARLRLERRLFDAVPLCSRFVTRLRARVVNRKLLHRAPMPLNHDVGYDAESGVFTFRDVRGRVMHEHPAKVSSADNVIPAYNCHGDVIPPRMPPPSSTIVLCPEQSGAWCYYDTALGSASWFPPQDAVPLYTHRVPPAPEPWPEPPPPMLDPRCQSSRIPPLQLNCLGDTPWMPLHRAADSSVRFLNKLTGCVHEGPWIALQFPSGQWCFANLVSRRVRWLPPHLWMEQWIYRPRVDSPVPGRSEQGQRPSAPPQRDANLHLSASPYACFDISRPIDARRPLPPLLARERVDGGAPYMHESGTPCYPPDEWDTVYTYPLDGFVMLTRNGHALYDGMWMTTTDADRLVTSTSSASPPGLPKPSPPSVAEPKLCGYLPLPPSCASADACLPAVPPSTGSEPELPSPPAPEAPASSDLAGRAAAQLLRYTRAWLLARSYGYGSLPEAWSDYDSMTDAWSSEPGLYVLRDSLLVLCASYRLAVVT